MRVIWWTSAIVALGAAAGPAAAQVERTVTVDGRSGPWNPRVNGKLPFGIGDAARPTTVVLRVVAGTKVRFAATGTTTTVPGGEAFGPDGQASFQTGAGMSGSGVPFPSRYVDRAQLPMHLNQLVGAFTDADGTVIGRPFAIGAAGEARVPAGAVAVSLGINDDRLAENSGSLSVKITTLGGTVTVE